MKIIHTLLTLEQALATIGMAKISNQRNGICQNRSNSSETNESSDTRIKENIQWGLCYQICYGMI